jgi:hypothetical protein
VAGGRIAPPEANFGQAARSSSWCTAKQSIPTLQILQSAEGFYWAGTVRIVRQHINAVGDVVLTHNGNDPQRSNNNLW